MNRYKCLSFGMGLLIVLHFTAVAISMLIHSKCTHYIAHFCWIICVWLISIFLWYTLLYLILHFSKPVSLPELKLADLANENNNKSSLENSLLFKNGRKELHRSLVMQKDRHSVNPFPTQEKKEKIIKT